MYHHAINFVVSVQYAAQERNEIQYRRNSFSTRIC